MTDRRAGRRQGPYVRRQPRARTSSGAWRRKRSDAGSRRPSSSVGCALFAFGVPAAVLLGGVELLRLLG
jgi:hypothetical protein